MPEMSNCMRNGGQNKTAAAESRYIKERKEMHFKAENHRFYGAAAIGIFKQNRNGE